MPGTPNPVGVALQQLQRLQRERDILDAAELQAVADARAAGATWHMIGQAVGMRRQHAQRKFAPLLVEWRTVQVRDTDTRPEGQP